MGCQLDSCNKLNSLALEQNSWQVDYKRQWDLFFFQININRIELKLNANIINYHVYRGLAHTQKSKLQQNITEL